MTDSTLTADQIHDQVHALRATALVPPEKIELGRQQLAAVLAGVREATGMQDVGELREFQGMPVVVVDQHDHLKLLSAGEQVASVVSPPPQEAPPTPSAEPIEVPVVEAEPQNG